MPYKHNKPCHDVLHFCEHAFDILLTRRRRQAGAKPTSVTYQQNAHTQLLQKAIPHRTKSK